MISWSALSLPEPPWLAVQRATASSGCYAHLQKIIVVFHVAAQPHADQVSVASSSALAMCTDVRPLAAPVLHRVSR